jgi:hypothetical protein
MTRLFGLREVLHQLNSKDVAIAAGVISIDVHVSGMVMFSVRNSRFSK